MTTEPKGTANFQEENEIRERKSTNEEIANLERHLADAKRRLAEVGKPSKDS